MNELALFAGAGGGILGGHLLGWRTVCAVEREPYPASVLMQRQNDGILPPFPIWDDVCTFDGKPWRGLIDVVSGGFPCQDISAAGNGAGIDGERSGLWREMARIIGEVRPRFVFVENSPLLVSRGLALVVSDLAEMGYDAEWCCISASDTGAPMEGDRLWIVATPDGEGLEGRVKADLSRTVQRGVACGYGKARPSWADAPRIPGVGYGMADWVDRLKAIGNGQVPRVAATAFAILSGKCAKISAQ